MKEHPMIFNGYMVRAILSGAKTQTRRTIVPPASVRRMDKSRVDYRGDRWWVGNHPGGGWWAVDCPDGPPRGTYPHADTTGFPCPFGDPGDLFWVRETWAPCLGGPCEPGNPVLFRADNFLPYDKLTWRPSIHMPRWASRITLEITDVRAQRIQDISVEDCRAEGIDGKNITDIGYRYLFGSLWNSIYGTWDSNPWVWAITFKRT